MKKQKYYLIWLQGQGDTHAKVVDEESWKWIIEKNLSAPVPQSIIDRYAKTEENTLEDIIEFKPTIGSWENDRALITPGIFVGKEQLDTYSDSTECIEDVARWKGLLGIKKWDGNFEGYIY